MTFDLPNGGRDSPSAQRLMPCTIWQADRFLVSKSIDLPRDKIFAYILSHVTLTLKFLYQSQALIFV